MTHERPRRTVLRLAGAALSSLLAVVFGSCIGLPQQSTPDGQVVSLPEPRRESDVSVEEAIWNRRSRREYGPGALTLGDVGQILWAAQGITDPTTGHRAAPSAGAKYPLDVSVVVGRGGVRDLDAGVYRYRPTTHDLDRVRDGDFQADLQQAALDQESVGGGAIDVVITAVDERTTERYGDRGRRRYVPMEAGHAGENLALQAEALGLSTVSIGAFYDAQVSTVVDAAPEERPLYVFPVGRAQ